MVLKSKTNTTNHICSDSYRPCEALGRPVHHPPEHRHDAIGDVAPWLVAWRWYTIIEKNDTLLYIVTIQYNNKIGIIHRKGWTFLSVPEKCLVVCQSMLVLSLFRRTAALHTEAQCAVIFVSWPTEGALSLLDQQKVIWSKYISSSVSLLIRELCRCLF